MGRKYLRTILLDISRSSIDLSRSLVDVGTSPFKPPKANEADEALQVGIGTSELRPVSVLVKYSYVFCVGGRPIKVARRCSGPPSCIRRTVPGGVDAMDLRPVARCGGWICPATDTPESAAPLWASRSTKRHSCCSMGVASRAADASTSARRYRPAMRVLMKFGLAGLCTAHLAGERPDAPNIELSDPQNRRPTIVDLIETSRDWSACALQRISMVEMLMGGRDTYQEVPFTGTSPTKTGWAASAVIR